MNYYSFIPYSAWKMGIDPDATGKAWRKNRQKMHLSQDALSDIFEAAGMPMSKAAISAVENGKHVPSIHHAFFFAELCFAEFGHCLVEDLVVTYRRSREADDRDQVTPLIIPYFHVFDEHLRLQVLVFFHGQAQVNTVFRNR